MLPGRIRRSSLPRVFSGVRSGSFRRSRFVLGRFPAVAEHDDSLSSWAPVHAAGDGRPYCQSRELRCVGTCLRTATIQSTGMGIAGSVIPVAHISVGSRRTRESTVRSLTTSATTTVIDVPVLNASTFADVDTFSLQHQIKLHGQFRHRHSGGPRAQPSKRQPFTSAQ
jgi:hypothetical protein